MRPAARARESLTTYRVGVDGSVVIDTNIFVDVLNEHPVWAPWSAAHLATLIAARRAVLVPIVYAELAAGFANAEALERALAPLDLVREDLSWEAAFLTGKAYKRYREQGGKKRSPLPDFYIGAHAQAAGYALLTRDAKRHRDYFPKLKVIAPQ